MFTPMEHQKQFASKWGEIQRIMNLDSCGTGKTLACIHAVKTHWPEARVLVFAPLSILQPAWGKDLAFGWPEATFEIASGASVKKLRALQGSAKWVITNHDTVKLVADKQLYKQFDVVIIDEADAFRNRSSQRSKAMNLVCQNVPVLSVMTGTPTPKSVLDIWHLAHLIDGGERLGRNFFGFRNQVCDARPVPGAPPGAMAFTDKDGANDHVTLALSDVTTRVTLDEVAELPETIYRDVTTVLPPKLRAQYEHLKRESILAMESGETVNAVHAGARVQKLLQTVSGAVYDEEGNTVNVHQDRIKLVMDLVEEADHSLVAFNWKHQRAGLEREAVARKIDYAVIDGSTTIAQREMLVEEFQAGKLQVLFAHPQSAGHGLTLTKAKRIIWASPTYRADLYEQFNHRIIRKGQKRKTEIIHIAAENTMEVAVYQNLMGKKVKMMDLLTTLKQLANAA